MDQTILNRHIVTLMNPITSRLHFAMLVKYRNPKPVQGEQQWYYCGYVSTPREWVEAVTPAELREHDVTFHAISSQRFDIPVTWGSLREVIDHLYWVGIDFIELPQDKQPSEEVILHKLSNIIAWLAESSETE